MKRLSTLDLGCAERSGDRGDPLQQASAAGAAGVEKNAVATRSSRFRRWIVAFPSWGCLRPAVALACLLALLAAPVYGQGVFIVVNLPHPIPLPRPIFRPRPAPPPPVSYKIQQLAAQARVVDQMARVQVSQSFVNTGSRAIEVKFLFPLPYDGAVDQLTFLVDGKEYPARLLPADKARSIYEDYVRRSRDPALLEWIGVGMFQTSVFPVPPGAERQVTLRYSQLLRKDGALTDFLFPLAAAKYTSKPIEKVSIQVSIESAVKIKSVYSPTHSVKVKRPDSRHAVVKYEASNQTPGSDFRLFYDVAQGELGASVLSYRPKIDEDGYFLLLASPEIQGSSGKPVKKTVILVADRSGSMSGKKIEQAKEALKFVLNNLHDGDLFNIVAYDSEVESFRPELERYSKSSRKAGIGFVEGVYAGGSTNIDQALRTALGMIQDASRPSYVIFLTDGRPTAGETNEAKLAALVKQANRRRTRLISLGVGYDVNSRLLDRMARDNFGRTEYVRPDEDIEAHVSRLYNRIRSPVMTDVAVRFELDGLRAEQGAPVNRVYPREVNDLFAGEQLVLLGRYKKSGRAKVVVSGRVGEKKQRFDFPARLVKRSDDQKYAFVEKLWAMRRVGEIIDELDLHGKNDELIEELVSLATKHGILTPYTSFLADENARPGELADSRLGRRRAGVALRRLAEAGGRAGFAQRAEKSFLQGASQINAGAARDAWSGAFGGAAARAPASGPAGGGYGAVYRDIDSDELIATDSVQNVGNETLYKRGNLWIAANARDADPEKDAAKIQVIERFSDEYFQLVRDNTAAENAVLARQPSGEELIIRFRGRLYRLR